MTFRALRPAAVARVQEAFAGSGCGYLGRAQSRVCRLDGLDRAASPRPLLHPLDVPVVGEFPQGRCDVVRVDVVEITPIASFGDARLKLRVYDSVLVCEDA